MKPTYLLSHGFGFSNEYWKNLIPLLNGDAVFFDENFAKNRRYIGIGHSVGFQKLHNSDIKFDYLIGLQGFVNFCGSEEELKKVRKQNIDRMIKMFKINALTSLKIFHKSCGYEEPFSKNITVEKLVSDLESLKESYKCRTDCPILIIGSDEDKIVPPSIINDNFKHASNVKTEKINDFQHALGFFIAEKVLEKIITCLNR
jgi:pimeloyl-[acyl-carrier protein] methyl ester esterase